MTTPAARLTATLAFAAGSLLAAPAFAGGYGCTTDCYRRVSTPPVYDTVSEQVMVRPPRTIRRVVPPVFDVVSEQVVVAPARRVWQTSIDAYGQEVGCWVTIPAQVATRQRRVMVSPPQAVAEVVPPAYATVQRQVLVAPARSGWVPAGGPAPFAGPRPAGYPGVYGPAGGGLGFNLGGYDYVVGARGSIYDGY
ncbi:hypothetical protein [uncultured Methylobacterium sp.]|jgi:hypothetical protein|uniref:hypothetical protein n=1 Tax=uncultured Methylobacterium sp. TaxID=157278 RepID=UPI0026251F62|nr:hypothetical protein [uncultured Methylobacterium sp.]